MKAQIALLFRDRAHLLKEYWVFYEQLHSTVQRVSDDDEDEEEEEAETDGRVHGAGEGRRLEASENPKNQRHIQVSLQNQRKRPTGRFYFNTL